MIRASAAFNQEGDIITVILMKEDGTAITTSEFVEAMIEYANAAEMAVNKEAEEEV